MMKLTRFVATSDGYKLMCSEAFTSDCACFVSLPAELDQDWHQAPTRQFVQLIRGTVEVTTTDGEVRRWSSGDQFIATDIRH